MKYKSEIIHILSYFAFFQYAPTLEEIHTFFPIKITKNDLKKQLDLLEWKYENRYTLGEYRISVESQKLKARNSIKKIESVRLFVKLLGLCPHVKMIGLSGSVAMMNAEKDHDVDLFIITAAGRLWTARIIGLILATIMGRRRKREERHAPNKICLNLFFDERDLSLPVHKRGEYGAHEVLQMKPLIEKDDMYGKFLKANTWVFKKFPNAHPIIPLQSSVVYKFGFIGQGILTFVRMTITVIEYLLKQFQRSIIHRHQTSEIITDTQLWFFPDDFEKKMK